MRLYEKDIVIPRKRGNKGLLKYFSEYISDKLPKNETPVRFAVTKTNKQGYHCELGILAETDMKVKSSIFDFKKRSYQKTEKFNPVLVVPTGIDAVLGGHAGDAGALARFFALNYDSLITHPNVVNASDINELPDNGVYLEGSILSRFMMGTIGLEKVRANKLLVILEEHEEKMFNDASINSVSAAQATYGLSAEVLILNNKKKFKMNSEFSKSGRAVGIIEDLEGLCNILNQKKIKNNYNAFALSSLIDVPVELLKKYYSDVTVNPWGGAEAILTHAISLLYNLPSAHSPMMESKEVYNLSLGIVDPRMAAESISYTFLQCILKGLYKSPKIITNQKVITKPGILNALDISCLIIPDKCVGLPTLAALEQEIPVIAVKENKNLMKNNLKELPWGDNQLFIVENYLEAAGVMNALKEGIALESVRRPLKHTKVLDYIPKHKL